MFATNEPRVSVETFARFATKFSNEDLLKRYKNEEKLVRVYRANPNMRDAFKMEIETRGLMIPTPKSKKLAK